MERYDRQASRLDDEGVEVNERVLKGSKLQGLYVKEEGRPAVLVNPALSPREKYCVLAEEAGHHYRTCGNIIDLSDARKRKQERAGRAWAYEHLLPLSDIARAWLSGIVTVWDLADHFEVTEDFLLVALEYYHQKYGEIADLGGVIVQFDPYIDVYAYEER